MNEQSQRKDEVNRVHSSKHSGARTAVEQGCDVSSVFPTLNQVNKTTTVENLPNNGFKGIVYKALKKASKSGKLNLKATAEAALIDHISCYPGMITRSAPADVVTKGFIENGMVDKKTQQFPDFYKLLKTCRRKVTKEEENLCKDSFGPLYNYMAKHGHVPDEVFEVSLLEV